MPNMAKCLIILKEWALDVFIEYLFEMFEMNKAFSKYRIFFVEIYILIWTNYEYVEIFG